jgi:lysophospholipase L1-like esterase
MMHPGGARVISRRMATPRPSVTRDRRMKALFELKRAGRGPWKVLARRGFQLGAALFLATALYGQQVAPASTPFRTEVEILKARLDAGLHARGSVVFLGSSSIRLWSTLEADFPGRAVVNCGFGGSTLRDWIYYGPELITHFEPSAIVMYCGENDLARGEDPEVVFADFRRFYNMLRAAFPEVTLAYISVKLSPLRLYARERIERFNALVADFIRTRKSARFLDIYPALLTNGGEADPSYFQPDGLHLNTAGYAVLRREVDAFLRERFPVPGDS